MEKQQLKYIINNVDNFRGGAATKPYPCILKIIVNDKCINSIINNNNNSQQEIFNIYYYLPPNSQIILEKKNRSVEIEEISLESPISLYKDIV